MALFRARILLSCSYIVSIFNQVYSVRYCLDCCMHVKLIDSEVGGRRLLNTSAELYQIVRRHIL
jgi:hypothetical protein